MDVGHGDAAEGGDGEQNCSNYQHVDFSYSLMIHPSTQNRAQQLYNTGNSIIQVLTFIIYLSQIREFVTNRRIQRPQEQALAVRVPPRSRAGRLCLGRGDAHWRHCWRKGMKKQHRQAIQKNPNTHRSLDFYCFTVGKTGVMALLDFRANPRIP
jgi:hypothetical protein